MAIVKERWKRHPEWNIEVSSFGRVRANDRVRKLTLHHSGYLVFTPYFGATQQRVHTLVLETYRGFRPERKEARHLDGDKRNNRLRNLRWGTKPQNMADQKKHGVYSAPPVRRKFSPRIYAEIFKKINKGATIAELTRQFGISRGAIYRQINIEGFTRGRI